MNKLSKQEYYDLLVTTAKNGNFPAYDDEGGCRYRASNGRRCAVGIVLPDELYRPDMEGSSIYGPLFDKLGHDWYPEEITEEDLELIQMCHDNCAVHYNEWNTERFINKLNDMSYFANVNKVN